MVQAFVVHGLVLKARDFDGVITLKVSLSLQQLFSVRVGLEDTRVAIQKVNLLECESLRLRDKLRYSIVNMRRSDTATAPGTLTKMAKTRQSKQQPPHMKNTRLPRLALPAPESTRYGVA
jgi:hypothetical protein